LGGLKATAPLQAPIQPNDTASIRLAQPQISPPAPTYRFPNGKSLVFTAEWHLFNAGTATIKFEPDGGTEKLIAVATSAGAVNLLFPVHDRFESHIDPKNFCSMRIFKHTEEGKRKRETQIQLDPARDKSVLDEKNLKTGESKHEENDAPACSTDILGGFFYLASRPLQPGGVETFPVSDGGKTTNVMARVEAREEVKVPVKSFPAIRVSIEATTGKLQGKGHILVWYTDDAEHMPVQMRATLQWGTVNFKLQRVETTN
jgi:hypothetical protein